MLFTSPFTVHILLTFCHSTQMQMLQFPLSLCATNVRVCVQPQYDMPMCVNRTFTNPCNAYKTKQFNEKLARLKMLLPSEKTLTIQHIRTAEYCNTLNSWCAHFAPPLCSHDRLYAYTHHKDIISGSNSSRKKSQQQKRSLFEIFGRISSERSSNKNQQNKTHTQNDIKPKRNKKPTTTSNVDSVLLLQFSCELVSSASIA